MSKALIFKAPPGEEIHLALTSGHTALVTDAGVELPPFFHREAIAKGCYPEGIPGEALAAARDPTRHEMIVAALKEMVAGEDPNDFTPNGIPHKSKVDERLGFVTERHEIDTAFNQVIDEERDEEEGAGGQQVEQTEQPPSATTAHASRAASKGGKGGKGRHK